MILCQLKNKPKLLILKGFIQILFLILEKCAKKPACKKIFLTCWFLTI